jgi:ATP-dependent Clp protease ATP-binding subunit ClpA
VIDEAGAANAHLKSMTRPPDLKEIDERSRTKLDKEKEEAVADQDFEKAASLRDKADEAARRRPRSRDQTGGRSHARRTASWTRKSSPKSFRR